MNYLEGAFYLGVQDGIDGILMEDVSKESFSSNKKVKQALTEYKAGVTLGNVIKEYDEETLFKLEMI